MLTRTRDGAVSATGGGGNNAVHDGLLTLIVFVPLTLESPCDTSLQ